MHGVGGEREPSGCREQFKEIIDKPDSGVLARVFHMSVLALILGATVAVLFETVPYYEGYALFTPLEAFFTICFSLEFGLRVWVADDIVEHFKSGFTWIDIIAILPGYVEPLVSHAESGMTSLQTLRVVRLVRMGRVLRLFKVARYSDVFEIVVRGLQKSRDGLFLVCVLIGYFAIVCGSFMYFFESDREVDLIALAQGQSNDQFSSIPAAMWWAIQPLTGSVYG